jgi:small subunit ribosomal protein S5
LRTKYIDPHGIDLSERVVEKAVNRTAKVMRGGRRFSFSALVVVGNDKGIIGFGYGKAADVPTAVEKARSNAKKKLQRVMIQGDTIPHQVTGRFGASRVVLKPACQGTGVIACPTVRAVLEMAGIKNILTKSLGSNNPINLVKATVEGLQQLVTQEEAARRRGVSVG